MTLINWLKGIVKNNKKQPANPILAPIEEQLVFAPSRHLTLGIELELGVLSASTQRIQPEARAILAVVNNDKLHGEAANHVLEVTTGICETVRDAERDINESLRQLAPEVERRGAALCGTGRMVMFDHSELTTDSNERYDYLRERRQGMFDAFNCMQGLHMHFGMRSADECIRYHNFFIHFLPHLLALSASTPFEDGVMTGLATSRPVVSEAMPFSGLPYPFESWEDYKNLCRVMVNADAIRSLKDLWWDLRPSPRHGTLEIRVCDQPSTTAEALAIVAFMHVLAHWFEEHHGWLDEMPRPTNWRLRENKWRAMRYGLDANLVVNNQGETRGIKTDILLWLERAAPYITRFKYEPYIETLRNMLGRGNGAERQRRMFALTNDLKEVSDYNVREWNAGVPLWDELEAREKESAAQAEAADFKPIYPLSVGF